MSARRGVPDWLKKPVSWFAILAASESVREGLRRLICWIEEVRNG